MIRESHSKFPTIADTNFYAKLIKLMGNKKYQKISVRLNFYHVKVKLNTDLSYLSCQYMESGTKYLARLLPEVHCKSISSL